MNLQTLYWPQQPAWFDPSISDSPPTIFPRALPASGPLHLPSSLGTLFLSSLESWFLLVSCVSKFSITPTGMPSVTMQSKVPFPHHTYHICLFQSTYYYLHYKNNMFSDLLLSMSHSNSSRTAGPCLSSSSLCGRALYSLTHSRWPITISKIGRVNKWMNGSSDPSYSLPLRKGDHIFLFWETDSSSHCRDCAVAESESILMNLPMLRYSFLHAYFVFVWDATCVVNLCHAFWEVVRVVSDELWILLFILRSPPFFWLFCCISRSHCRRQKRW